MKDFCLSKQNYLIEHIINNCPNILEAYFDSIIVYKSNIVKLINFLFNNQKCKKISFTSLDISYCFNTVIENHSITSITFNEVINSLSINYLLYINKCHKLTILNLSRIVINYEKIRLIFNNNYWKLTKLNLHFSVILVNNFNVIKVFMKHKNIVDLNITHCAFGDRLICDIINILPNLKNLYLDNNSNIDKYITNIGDLAIYYI